MRPWLLACLAACGAPDEPRSREGHEEPDVPIAAREARDEGSSRPSRLRGAPRAAPANEVARPPAPRFTGKPIDLDLNQADLHNVFRLLAEVGGVDIAVGDDVRGTVTLRLRAVPWDQALDTIVKMERLRVTRNGRVHVISRASSASSSSASAPP